MPFLYLQYGKARTLSLSVYLFPFISIPLHIPTQLPCRVRLFICNCHTCIHVCTRVLSIGRACISHNIARNWSVIVLLCVNIRDLAKWEKSSVGHWLGIKINGRPLSTFTRYKSMWPKISYVHLPFFTSMQPKLRLLALRALFILFYVSSRLALALFSRATDSNFAPISNRRHSTQWRIDNNKIIIMEKIRM